MCASIRARWIVLAGLALASPLPSAWAQPEPGDPGDTETGHTDTGDTDTGDTDTGDTDTGDTDGSTEPVEPADPSSDADANPDPAEGQPLGPVGGESNPIPSVADTAVAGDTAEVSEVSTAKEPDEPTQELAARIGLAAGGRSTAGGFHLEGTYLYRLTDADWLDQSVGFTFGGLGAACFRDRSDELICDHGVLDGFAVELGLGIRHYFAAQDRFQPFVRGGLILRGVFYSGDDVRGLAIPLWAGGGVRATVADRIAVVADASLRTGFGFFNKDLGIEPQADLIITAGVEFVID